MLTKVAWELRLLMAFLTMSCLVSRDCFANMLSMSTFPAATLLTAFRESFLSMEGLKNVEIFDS